MGRVVPAAWSRVVGRWPLVGRSDEFSLARERVAQGGSVVIAGDAGVGKTRLAHELIESAEAQGWGADWAVGTHAAQPIPFGAFAHLVTTKEVGAGLDAMLRQLIESLHRHGNGRFVLGVDDAHLLDGVSAVLVHQLVSRRVASVVLTTRGGGPVPDPILGLWKDDLAVRLELQPLSRAEVTELLMAVLDGPMDGAGLRILWELSRGNVLFLRELVVEGLESGALRCDEALWHWDGPLEPGQRLRDVVRSRIGGLDDVERDALEVLAVGEPVPVSYVNELFSPEVITGLERRGLVSFRHESADLQLRLAHPLFGEVVRAGVPTLRLTEIRRRLADAFQAHDELRAEDTLRVATWRAGIGDGSEPCVLVAGARHAWAVGEVNLAERLTRLALGAGPDFEASYLLGKALVAQGRFEQAVETWKFAEEVADSDAQRATLAAGIAHLLLGGLGRPGEAGDAVRRAAKRMEDPTARRDLDAVRALTQAISAGTTGERIEHATAVLRHPGLSDRLRATATLALVTASIEAGHLDLAVEAAKEAIASADAETGGAPATILRTSLADALWPAGRLDEAESVASNGYARALEHADHRRGLWCRLLGSIALVRGNARRAVAWLKEGELVLRQQDDSSLRGVLVRLCMAAALLGDLDLADHALHGTEHSDALFARGWDLELERARAWLCMARGERSNAIRHLEDGAKVAAYREHLTVRAFALHDLARFGETVQTAHGLRDLAENIDGALVPTMAAHAHGLARRDGPMLDSVAGAFAKLGYCLYAAEAAAAGAAAHRAAGKPSSAAASANRAHAWMERCEGARTPALAFADQDENLTRREREVATLAARGLSDQQIADGLFISVRTVQTHLHCAYAKLEVAGRRELAGVLGER